MNSILRLFVAASVAGFSLALPARAQCLEWDGRYAPPGIDGDVHAFVVFDDGNGPALFVGGDFTTAGDKSAAHIARWDGVNWSSLGAGVSGPVYTLEVFNDGSGPALFVGGNFTMAGGSPANRIAKWNGTSWSSLSTGMNIGIVFALTTFNDGTGPALFAGGVFSSAGGTNATSIAKWNGTSWSSVGGGILGTVYALSSYTENGQPALFAGGEFTIAGGLIIPNLARWNGANWTPVGLGVQSGPDAGVFALRVFDIGSGALLGVGGVFDTAGGLPAGNIASWNGSVWAPLGAGTDDRVSALRAFNDGTGPALFAGGDFLAAGSVQANHVAKWNVSGWSALDGGTDDSVHALISFNDGSGSALYAGGSFLAAGAKRTNHVARWKSLSWSPLDDRKGVSDTVFALTTFDPGTGTKLYAGGEFTSAGIVEANHIAQWSGANWSSLDSGTDGDVYAIGVFDDGLGSALYAGGSFAFASGVSANRIARWNGSSWSELEGGVNGGPVYALATFGAGVNNALYAGGGFSTADGFGANRIARWNGTSWSALGLGLQGGGAMSSARALCVFDDGTGPALYCGGIFATAGGLVANNVARWNGSVWSVLGTGTNGAVRALAVFNDGTGANLYAGGDFTEAGGNAANHVARWNGSAWSNAGRGTDGPVRALAVFSDGGETALYAGGDFTEAGTANANHIARWNGEAWSKLDTGIDGIAEATVHVLAVFEDGADLDSDLYVGGTFTTSGDKFASNIAEWHGCSLGNAYCFGDGLDPLVTALCPCGNTGSPGHGCANSNSALGGAHLTASGSTIPNTIRLTCTGVPNNTLCTFLRASLSNPGGAVFGDGVRCLEGAAIRFGSQNAGQIGNPPNSVSSTTATVPSGNTRYYQLYYRNPNSVFCTPELFNISNGYRIPW